MNLSVLKRTFAVCRLEATESIPNWALESELFSITMTADELSIVCEQTKVPNSVKAEKNWKALKVQGPLDFNLTGILASISTPLADAKVSIFAVSTYDTDYVLVKETDLEKSKSVLKESGFSFLN